MAEQIDFGTCSVGSSTETPVYYLKNLGEVETTITITYPDLPSGITVQAYISGDGESWNPVGGGGFVLQPLSSIMIKWTLQADTSLSPGQISFTIQFNSGDSA